MLLNIFDKVTLLAMLAFGAHLAGSAKHEPHAQARYV